MRSGCYQLSSSKDSETEVSDKGEYYPSVTGWPDAFVFVFPACTGNQKTCLRDQCNAVSVEL